jgi:shikimate kinase
MEDSMIWVLVGHRGSGKTTLGKLLAIRLQKPFVDLDQKIETETGRSPGSWLAESQRKFRDLEVSTLEKIGDGTIVAPGAGIETIPDRMGVIWLYRHGWEHEAVRNRPRVRPEMSMEAELAWMRQEREPRYLLWADAKFEAAFHEKEEATGERLFELIRRLERSSGSHLVRKSWWIGDPTRLEKINARATQIQAAGVELRSDLIPAERIASQKEPFLHSIRTNVSEIKHPCVDVDLKWLKGDPKSSWIVSDHPKTWKKPTFPVHAKSIKWAPTPQSFKNLNDYRNWCQELRTQFEDATILPQTSQWTWLRIVEAVRNNRWNYISSMCERNDAGTPSWSEWALYGHASPKAKLYGLIGNPVDQSPGDEFHNQFHQTRKNDAFYVKVPIQEEELPTALDFLEGLGVSGLSVTAPFKRSILSCHGVRPDPRVTALQSANTLTCLPEGGWMASNTDVEGMKKTLESVKVELHDVLLVGLGGVAPAILEELRKHPFEVEHVGSREMKPDLWNRKWDLVINASGRNVTVPSHKKITVWCDLRYGVHATNDGGEFFVPGDLFYEAQALEQLRTWGY